MLCSHTPTDRVGHPTTQWLADSLSDWRFDYLPRSTLRLFSLNTHVNLSFPQLVTTFMIRSIVHRMHILVFSALPFTIAVRDKLFELFIRENQSIFCLLRVNATWKIAISIWTEQVSLSLTETNVNRVIFPKIEKFSPLCNTCFFEKHAPLPHVFRYNMCYVKLRVSVDWLFIYVRNYQLLFNSKSSRFKVILLFYIISIQFDKISFKWV